MYHRRRSQVLFFGLSRLLPLFTAELLAVRALAARFFGFVGFSLEAYPERVAALPPPLFGSLLATCVTPCRAASCRVMAHPRRSSARCSRRASCGTIVQWNAQWNANGNPMEVQWEIQWSPMESNGIQWNPMGGALE